ncbi:hypothetical protein ACQ4PT_016790 [Festuca glaucescens]
MAVEFGWWPMSPWLSPGAACFIFFNVLVGAIALMSSSRGQQHDGRESGARRRLARTASTVVLDSLRSISIFSFHSVGDYSVPCSAPAPPLHHVQEHYHPFQEQETQEVSAVAPQLPEPEAASLAEEETVVLPHSAPVAAAAAPGASTTASESQVEDGESSISLDEAYALARARRQSPAAAGTVARAPAKKEPAAEVKGRYAEEAEGKAEVNARAEQFIRQFREELKLERINSIVNYTNALRRGAGAAAAAPR